MRIATTLILCFYILHTTAQQTDSVKYANGYLYFHEYGKGEPVIVLTGGPGAGHLQLENVALKLGETHRAILLEQRGTGRSMPTPYDSSTVNLRTAMADITLVLDHLKLPAAHILGHSWGSMLAMNYGAKYPTRVKSLILLSPGPMKLERAVFEVYAANREARLSPQEKENRDAVAKKMKNGSATAEDKKKYEKWELIPVLYDRSQVDSLAVIINKGGLNPKTGSFLLGSLSKSNIDLAKELPKLLAPIHIICGNQDPGGFISYETKIAFPKASLRWINEAGHFPMYEQPEKFFSALREVLK